MATFAERLKRARDARGLRTNELDRAIGMKTLGYVSKLESGARGVPGGEKLLALARVLRVRPEWLTDGRGPMDLEGAAVDGSAGEDEPPPSGAGAAHPDMYPNRTLFIALHQDQISPQTRAFLESMARSSGDATVEEWRRIAMLAEHDRRAFAAELEAPSGIGDPGGFGDPDEPPKKRRR